MGFFEAFVAVFGMMVGTFAIGCVTAVIMKFIGSRAEIARARALGGPETLAAQVQALRDEVRQLREQNADLILSYDTAVQRLSQLHASSAPAAERELARAETPVARRVDV